MVTGTPRRRGRQKLYVVNLPPPWRRSLTESGMTRAPTRADHVVVALFLVVLAGLAALLALLS
jgi:hypothetical protein